jgi:hypothetical protein
MLNIPGHKGNTNQNDSEILPPLHSEWLPSITQTTNAGEDAGKKEILYFSLSFLHLFTCIYIVWVISSPHFWGLFHPLVLQFC